MKNMLIALAGVLALATVATTSAEANCSNSQYRQRYHSQCGHPQRERGNVQMPSRDDQAEAVYACLIRVGVLRGDVNERWGSDGRIHVFLTYAAAHRLRGLGKLDDAHGCMTHPPTRQSRG